MANIRVDALTEVTTIADDDVVMVDGKQGVRATTWETLKNLIKQQCGINELNTNIQDYSYNTGSNYTYICSKIGRIVVLMVTIETSSKANIEYFTLPEKYRPKFDLFVPATRTGSGSHGFATIRASGAVSLFPETVGWNTFSVAFIS